MSELKYWLWLSSLVWLRPRAKVLLINALGGARETYFAAESELKELDFLSEREVAMLSDKSLESAKKIAVFPFRLPCMVYSLLSSASPS